MRALVVIVVIFAILFLVGWLRYDTPEGNPTLQVDSQEVQEDTGEMVNKSKEVLKETGDAIKRELNDDDREVVVDTEADAEPEAETETETETEAETEVDAEADANPER